MNKLIVDRSYQMKCDICGKEETIPIQEAGPFFFKPMEWFTRKWSHVSFSQFPGISKETCCGFDLCPTCTKKFKKLLMSVEIEEPGPVVKE